MDGYLRGELARKAGIHPETVRFYEKNGLIPEPQRTEAGYRIYPEDILFRLEFIKSAKFAGFALEEIKHLFSLVEQNQPDPNFINNIIDEKLDGIGAKIAELQQMAEFLITIKENIKHPEICPVLDNILRTSEK